MRAVLPFLSSSFTPLRSYEVILGIKTQKWWNETNENITLKPQKVTFANFEITLKMVNCSVRQRTHGIAGVPIVEKPLERMETTFPSLMRNLWTHYGRHCEPFSSQNALDCRIFLHIQSRFFLPEMTPSDPDRIAPRCILVPDSNFSLARQRSHCSCFTKWPLRLTVSMLPSLMMVEVCFCVNVEVVAIYEGEQRIRDYLYWDNAYWRPKLIDLKVPLIWRRELSTGKSTQLKCALYGWVGLATPSLNLLNHLRSVWKKFAR